MRKCVWFACACMLAMLGCSGGSARILRVTGVTPTTLLAGSGATNLTVTGDQFSQRTSVQVGSTALQTTLISETQMTAVVPATVVNTAGTFPISIVDAEPAQQGGTVVLATSFNLTITNPAPAITAANPTTLVAGQPSATVSIAGSGFVPSTTATVNGSARTLTLVDAQHVQVTLTADDLLYARSLPLVLTNAAPGGGSTQAVTLTVTNYTKPGTQYHAYGDSITFGYQLKMASSAYPYLLATAHNLQLTDLAIVGDQACDTFQYINRANDGYAAAASAVSSYMIGTNDTYTKGSGAYEATFNLCDLAVVSWLALPSSARIRAGDAGLQATGGCSNTPNASHLRTAYCATAGSITAQSFTSFGSPIYAWVLIDDAAPVAATMQMTVDGAAGGTLSIAPKPAIATMNGSKSSIALVRIAAAAGVHAVTLTAPAGYAGLLALGTVPASRAGLPPIIVGDVPAMRTSYGAYASTDVQLAYSADVRANVALLRSDGLDVRFAPDRLYMTGQDVEMADGIHPNELGQQHLQSAFETGFVALNATGGLVAQIVGGVTRLAAADVLTLAPQSGDPYELAADTPALTTLANRSATMAATVMLPPGEVTTEGAASVQVAPGGVVTLYRPSAGAGAGTAWRVVRTSDGERSRLTPVQ